MTQNVIDVIEGGGIVAHRYWHNVPRVGDKLILMNKRVLRVREVVWGEVNLSERTAYDAWVQLVCDYVETLP